MKSRRILGRLAELLHGISDCAFQFECNGSNFIAIPQEDWMAVDANRADLKALHQHVAGRLEICGAHCIVFSCDDNRTSKCVDASIAQILTRRELQIAMFVAQGKVDKEIARQLGISDHTVREHLRRACAKLSVSKRSALVASIMRPSRTLQNSGNVASKPIDFKRTN